MKHLRGEKVVLSGAKDDYGFDSLCGLERAQWLSKNWDAETCGECLTIHLRKLQSEIETLKQILSEAKNDDDRGHEKIL